MKPEELLIGAGGGGADSPTQTEDNLFSRDRAEIVLGLCEGEIEGLENGLQSIFVGDVPLQAPDGHLNFTDLTVDTSLLLGKPHDPAHGDPYPQITFQMGGESSNQDVGVRLRKNTPVSRVSPMTLRGQITQLEIRLNINQLSLSNSDGTFNNTIVFRIQYKPASQPDSAYQNYRGQFSLNLTGKTTSGYIREFVLTNMPTLPNDDWQVRITKLSGDIETDANNVTEMSWESWQFITKNKRAYPGTSVLAVRAQTGNQFTSIPDIYSIIKGQKLLVPTNYNGHLRKTDGTVWNGITFKKEYSNNPAWVVYNCIMNPEYGLARTYHGISVNPFDFEEAAAYCDELVSDGGLGTQFRYSLDIMLENQQPANAQIQYLAGAFGAAVTDGLNGKIYLFLDRWREPSLLFTPEAIQGGEPQYTFPDVENRYNDITVSFINPDLGWVVDKRRVFDQDAIDRDGRVPLDFEAVGCINEHEATRRAYMRLITSQTEGTTVSFVTTRLGLLLKPYDTFWLSDVDMGWGASTRVRQKLGDKLFLHAPLYFPELTTFSCYLQGHLGVHKIFVTPATAGDCDELTITGNTEDLSDLPDDALIAIQQANGDLGLIKPFRVLTIEEVENLPDAFRVTAMEVNPLKYDAADQCVSVGSVPYSFRLPGAPTPPEELQLQAGTGQLQLAGDGTVLSRISASWKIPKSSFVDKFEIRYAEVGSDQWVTVTTSGLQTYLGPVTDGAYYTVGVRSLNRLGQASAWVVDTILVTGKSAPPADVTGLGAIVESYGTRLVWQDVPDADLAQYELRIGDAWETATFLATTKASEFRWEMKAVGSYNILVKAVDTSGNYSQNPAEKLVEIGVPSAPRVTVVFEHGTIVVNWTYPSTQFAIQAYRVSRSALDVTDVSDAEILTDTLSQSLRQPVDFTGPKRFWVQAIDAYGNLGTAGFVDYVPGLPSISGLRAEVIDNNVLLRWTDNAATLPIDDHLIRKGDVFSTAEEIYRSRGTFAPIFEHQGGTFRYWVAPVDTAGNIGTPSSILANVNQPPDYVLLVDHGSTYSGTRTNMFVDPDTGHLLGAVNTTEDYATHFSSHGFTSWQDAVDAGYAKYLMPGLTSFEYVEEYDYGTLLAGTVITLTLDIKDWVGVYDLHTKISVRALNTDPWIDFTDVTSTAAGNFRYVKFTLSGTTTTDNTLFEIRRLNLRLDTKKRREEGIKDCLATDVGGTVVTLTTPFYDITGVKASPIGADAAYAVVDYVDAPNPTEIKLLCFDSSGTRVDGRISYEVTGY